MTKLLPELRDLPYSEPFKSLKLESLVFRRLRGDVIEVWKCLSGIYNVDYMQFFSLVNNRRTRGHSRKLIKPRVNSTLYQLFFTNRVIDTWNSLPANVVELRSVDQLKGRLDKHWQNSPLRFEF